MLSHPNAILVPCPPLCSPCFLLPPCSPLNPHLVDLCAAPRLPLVLSPPQAYPHPVVLRVLMLSNTKPNLNPNSNPNPNPRMSIPSTWLSLPYGSPNPTVILALRPRCSHPVALRVPKLPNPNPNPNYNSNPNPRISVPTTWLSSPYGSPSPTVILATRPRCSHPTTRGSPCPVAT